MARRPSLPTGVTPPPVVRALVTGMIVTVPPVAPLTSVPKSRSSVLISVLGRTTAAVAVRAMAAADAGADSAAAIAAAPMVSARAAPRSYLVPRIPTDSAPVWHILCQQGRSSLMHGLGKGGVYVCAGDQALSATPPIKMKRRSQ